MRLKFRNMVLALYIMVLLRFQPRASSAFFTAPYMVPINNMVIIFLRKIGLM